MILADQHVHSHHSADCKESMDRIAVCAEEAGLTSLCFTEHNDFDYPPVDDKDLTPDFFEPDITAYHDEYLSIAARHAGRIDLRFGIELGLQQHVADRNRALVSEHPFDLVIASIHVARRRDPYFPSFYEGRTEEEALAVIFEETLENIRLFDDFDVLGHLDYAVRYLPSRRQRVDLTPYRDTIDEILRLLIRREQALEINTQSMWKRQYPETHPPRPVLMRYRELGGRIITFGSDAHQADHVGGAFAGAAAIAREAGFTEYAVYRARSAEFYPL